MRLGSWITFVLFCVLLAVWVGPGLGHEPVRAKAPFGSDRAKTYQQAWAKDLGIPVQVTGSIGMELSLIPPGQFLMGSPAEEEWHRPDEVLHRVTL